MEKLSERLKALEGKASRVPWQIRFGGKDEDSGFCMASKIGNNVVCERWPAAGATEYNPHDPRLIMELVNNLPAIIAALDSSEHKAKCVQFAEDVEKLESRCENIRLSKNGGAWYLDADVLEGPNIHSVAMNQCILEAVSEAARSAVAALTKGEA